MEKKQKALALIVGAAALEKAIGSIKNRGAKLDGDIQHAALSVLKHVDGCGDTTLADRLFNAMPNGSRRLALAEWFVTFGRMVALNSKTDSEAIKTGRVFKYEHERKTDMEGAVLKPWHECRREAAPSEVFDVQAAFASLMKRIHKAQKDGVRLVADGNMLIALEALAAKPADVSVQA